MAKVQIKIHQSVEEQNASFGGGRVGSSRACNECSIQAGQANGGCAPTQSPCKIEAITIGANLEANKRTIFVLSAEPEGQRRLDNP